MKHFLLLALFSICCVSITLAQTTIEGKVIEEESGEPVIYGSVALYKNDVLVTGTETDFDGYYSISNIDPGTYDVEFSYTGFTSQRISGVLLVKGKAIKLDAALSSGVMLDLDVEVIAYKVPLIEQDNTSQGKAVTAEEIRTLPTRSVNTIASTTAGVASSDDGAALNFRGSRSGGTNYYVDGIRVNASMVPASEIDQLQMITAGIEAQYGDVMGGIVSITTKGPSLKYTGGVEAETSEFLDAFGYNLLSANFSGPILKRKKLIDGTEYEQSVLGFRVSGQYTSRAEDNPPATALYMANDEMKSYIEQNPISVLPGTNTRVSTAEMLRNSDVNSVDASPYQKNEVLNLNAKIDARLSDAIDVTLTGAFTSSSNQFSPGRTWRLLNADRNPTNTQTRYRGNFRFRHRLSGKSSLQEATEAGAERKNSLIRNAAYTLQVGYEKSFSETKDEIHGDDYFNYGYIGRFDYDWQPAYANPANVPGDSINFGWGHVDYTRVFQSYTPDMTINPLLARYNNQSNQEDEFDFLALNGSIQDTYETAWGLHANSGTVYNSNNKSENDLYTFNANSTFDLYPSGSDGGRHNIQFGILYEQRVSRNWGIAPFNIWEVARQSANRHLSGIDTNNIIRTVDTLFNPPGFDLSIPIYAALVDQNIGDDLLFYQSVRDLLGKSIDEYVNIDAIHPSQLSLDMFSPDELTNQGIVAFSGYDYLGNKLTGDVAFEDIFTFDPTTGRRNFNIAPNTPNYAAAFIQDKFTYKDIIFRLGLRVDRFDANTKILKDPYSFYEVYGANDFHNEFGGNQPSTIGDDYKVYTADASSNNVVAYRDGEQWYFPNGTTANDGRVIFGGEIVNPKIVNPDINVRSKEFDPSTTFEDYEPEINWMPRLAFSFPISDIANFFAHYDVLVQRPSNSFVSSLRYYYFNEPGRISTTNPINNPALRPQKTIDYAVGFQQKLSNSSALKINAYYREMRDMIQARTYLYIPAPLNQYETYGNLDFGTVKGFTFQYDLRRTNNVQLRVDYTLQFASGTGSGSNTQRGNTSTRGNLRVLFPLSFDERHRINVNIDYRYGSGKKYNGPRWFGKDVFANAGINFQAIAFSGRPFTKAQQPAVLGGSGVVGNLNGARRPWSFRMDTRIDKSFTLGRTEGKRGLNFNVYLRINNLLDSRNILGVYTATGSPTDDGYIASTQGQASLRDLADSGRELEPYLEAYDWAVQNPYNYSLPRRIVLGAILDF